MFISIVLIGIVTSITIFQFQTTSSGPVLDILDKASIVGNNSYEPNTLTTLKGDTIQVKNKDSLIHTVTNGISVQDKQAGKLFDTGIIKPGEIGSIVIANLPAGEYDYFCKIHPYMKGIIQVIELPSNN